MRCAAEVSLSMDDSRALLCWLLLSALLLRAAQPSESLEVRAPSLLAAFQLVSDYSVRMAPPTPPELCGAVNRFFCLLTCTTLCYAKWKMARLVMRIFMTSMHKNLPQDSVKEQKMTIKERNSSVPRGLWNSCSTHYKQQLARTTALHSI